MNASTCIEHAVVFDCQGETLVGVLSLPAGNCEANPTGVIIIVGGPQYRAGSHRHFVLLARALADGGHAVLRFDVRGMGDSSGAARSFEALRDDVRAGVDALMQRVQGLSGVVLWGLCDGASAALLYQDDVRDARVAGLCLLNPWIRTATSLARTHVKHYYAQRLMQRDFWTKLLRGGVANAALRELWGALRTATARASSDAPKPAYPQRMASACRDARSVLLLLSGNDYTAREFVEFTSADAAWKGAISRPQVLRHDLTGADHTFSTAADARAVERLTADWLQRLSDSEVIT